MPDEQSLNEKRRYALKKLDEALQYIKDVPAKHDVGYGGTLYTSRAEKNIESAKMQVERYFNYQVKNLKAEQKYKDKLAKKRLVYA